MCTNPTDGPHPRSLFDTSGESQRSDGLLYYLLQARRLYSVPNLQNSRQPNRTPDLNGGTTVSDSGRRSRERAFSNASTSTSSKLGARTSGPFGLGAHQDGTRATKSVVTTLSVLVLVISAIGYLTIGRLGGHLASAGNLGLGKGYHDGAQDILLVGSDSRTDAHGKQLTDEELAKLNAGGDEGELNTDTLIIVRVPQDGSRATAISIPRDTYVHDDKYGNMKINAVYASYANDKKQELQNNNKQHLSDTDVEKKAIEAGRTGLLSAVAKLTGVDIDHYAEVGLDSFVSLTDAVGGVDVCLNQPVDEPLSGAKFPAGRQTLNGQQALSFVRQRHDLPRGDLDRIVRQQAYMASLANKTLSTGTLTNPGKLNALSKAIESSVVLDDGWDAVSFATQLSNMAGGNVEFTTIPVTSMDGTGDYGESIVTVDPNQVHDFMKQAASTEKDKPKQDDKKDPNASDQPKPPAGMDTLKKKEINVLNAGKTSGQAGNIAAFLTDQGLNVPVVSNAIAGMYNSSQILAANPNSDEAKALSQMLGGLPIKANDSLDDTTLIVVSSDDYKGPVGTARDTPSPVAATTSAPAAPVGTPGDDFGQDHSAPKLDAGGDGPRCVN